MAAINTDSSFMGYIYAVFVSCIISKYLTWCTWPRFCNRTYKYKKISLEKSIATNTLQPATVDSVESGWCWRRSISVHIDLPRRTAPIVSAACHSKSIKTGLEGRSKETGDRSDSWRKRVRERRVGRRGGWEKRKEIRRIRGDRRGVRKYCRMKRRVWRKERG